MISKNLISNIKKTSYFKLNTLITSNSINKRKYNTIIDRVTQSATLNYHTLACISSIQYLMMSCDISMGTSLMIMGSFVRLSHPWFKFILQKIVDNSYGYEIRK